VLKSVSSNDAAIVHSVLAFAIAGRFILNDIECLTQNGLTFDQLIELEDMGIVGSIPAFSSRLFSWTPGEAGSMAIPFAGKLALIVVATDLMKKIDVPSITLSRVGRDLLTIGEFHDPPMPYIQRVADILKEKGFTVSLGHKTTTPTGKILWTGAQQL
jgi:hypothetical protein